MNLLARNWWALLIRGLLAVAFGLLTWAWPGLTLLILVTLFGAYALFDGLFAIVAAVRAVRRHEDRWWVMALEGVLGIATGVIAFVVPTAAAIGLLVLAAIWALSTGLLEVMAAYRLRQHIEGEWLLALSGVLSIAFGVLLLLRPTVGLLALAWLFGAYAVAFGVVEIALSLKLRQLATRVPSPPHLDDRARPQPI